MPCTNNHRTQRRGFALKVKPATLTVIAAILIVLSLFAVSTHVSAQSVNAISGRTTDINGSGMSDVSLTLSGNGSSSSIMTDANGNYAFANVVAGGSYTLTPFKAYFNFGPRSFTFNALSSNQTADFTGAPVLCTISGSATDYNGVGLGDVTITFTNSRTGQSAIMLTDASGNYTYSDSIQANTVAASKSGYSFDPSFVTFVGTYTPCANHKVYFTGVSQTYSVSGRVTDANENGIGNVLMQLSSSNNLVMRSTVTDTNGYYSFANLPAGLSYTVIPSKTGYAFNISRLTVNNLSANRTLFPLTGTTRPYTLGGTVRDANSNALADTQITLSRAGSSQITIATTVAGGTYSFTNVAGEGTYTVTPTKAGFSFDPQSQTFSNVTGNQTANFTARAVPGNNPNLPDVQFAAPQFDYAESDSFATIIVSRVGDTSGTTTVDYLTTDGTAQQRTDYTTASGTLTFAPGETAKAFSVLITDDAYPEPNETVTITLSNATGANLGARSTATLVIHDNDFGTPTSNPIDDARFFVRQQYLDFLSRQPDAGGWDYWTNLINGTPGNNPAPCATNDAACLDNRRISVSAAFFIEQEFQDTGSFVYRFYKGTLSRRPNYAEFVPDRSRIVGGANLEASKQAFANAWTQRAEFLQKYPQSLSAGGFVNALLTTVKETSGVDLSAQRQSYVDQLQAGGSRAQIIRSVVDTAAFQQAEYNRAFVLMQYFGYLKRDPDADGYNFWLDVLSNRVAGNYRAMVCAFITSAEYQDRFSSVRTRTDNSCSAVQ